MQGMQPPANGTLSFFQGALSVNKGRRALNRSKLSPEQYTLSLLRRRGVSEQKYAFPKPGKGCFEVRPAFRGATRAFLNEKKAIQVFEMPFFAENSWNGRRGAVVKKNFHFDTSKTGSCAIVLQKTIKSNNLKSN